MKYGDITVKRITSSHEYEDAVLLLAEEFPDHHHTNLDFYDYYLIAKLGEETVGLVTANKYLPNKVMIADIVVSPEHRSKLVGMKLLHTLTQKVKLDGYSFITGITNKKNREALNLYKKLGGHQEEMIVTTALLDETIAIMDRKEMILKHRENNIKER